MQATYAGLVWAARITRDLRDYFNEPKYTTGKECTLVEPNPLDGNEMTRRTLVDQATDALSILVYGRSLEALMMLCILRPRLTTGGGAGCSISGTVDILRGEIEMALALS